MQNNEEQTVKHKAVHVWFTGSSHTIYSLFSNGSLVVAAGLKSRRGAGSLGWDRKTRIVTLCGTWTDKCHPWQVCGFMGILSLFFCFHRQRL